MKINTPASKYIEAFKALKEAHNDKFYFTADTILVEKIFTEELKHEFKKADGTKAELFLAGGQEKKIDGLDMNLPTFCRVLAVGEGFVTPGEEEVAVEAEVGDIVLVGKMSVNWFSVFGSLTSTSRHEIGITRENEIKLRFKGQGAYDACFNFLNEFLANAQEKETLQS